MPSQQIILEPLKHFYGVFKDGMSIDDHIEFFCNRKIEESETFLRLETYEAEKLSRVVMEEYSIRSKMRGSVIMTFPRPDNDVPIFFFQIGGRGDRSVAVLDVSPTLGRIDYGPLIPVYEKYRELLGLKATKVAWLTKICSPYLLHCQYEEIDCELFIEAMQEYLKVWIENYYRPGQTLNDKHDVEVVTNAIYKFKYVLHHYDPAYGVFARAWGKGAADAFVHLECSDHPAFLPPEDLETKMKLWENTELNIIWTRSAQLRVMEAPASVQPDIRQLLEEKTSAAGFGIITPEVFERYKKDYDTPPAG